MRVIETIRDALRFYGNQESWKPRKLPSEPGRRDASAINDDRGHRAREAFSQIRALDELEASAAELAKLLRFFVVKETTEAEHDPNEYREHVARCWAALDAYSKTQTQRTDHGCEISGR